jgi:hypothetical protein
MILEHGIMGTPKELGYVHEALEREFLHHEGASNYFLIHSATCNEPDSLDGIEVGGLRLAEEVNELLQDYTRSTILPAMQHCGDSLENHAIALSFLGFSLGGLYCRYALPFIEWNVSVTISGGDDHHHSPISIPVFPNLFATAATPHLGIKRMTFWKLPRCLEPVVAWYLGQTGRDLFRRPNQAFTRVPFSQEGDGPMDVEYEDLIQQMNLDPYFLQPLSKFYKRIAFANAFSTDFCVGTQTAAFLSDHDQHHSFDDEHSAQTTPSAHFHVDEDPDNHRDGDSQDERSLYAAVRFATSPSYNGRSRRFSTESFDNTSTSIDQSDGSITDGSCQRSALIDRTPSYKSMSSQKSDEAQSVADMAMSLDSLGWTKVLVDVRPHLPSLWRRVKHQPIIQKDSDTKVYSSSTLKKRLSGSFDFNTLPFAHSYMVASTKNKFQTWMYKDGRSFVDQVLAKDLVRETLRFDPAIFKTTTSNS